MKHGREEGAEDRCSAKKAAREDEEDVVSSKKDEGEHGEVDSSRKDDGGKSCTICMCDNGEVDGTEERILIPHQCQQCSAGAWHICENCNTSILSRICPICRGKYAPLVMHKVVVYNDVDADLKPYYGLMLFQIIITSNVLQYSPPKDGATGKLRFSLPTELSALSRMTLGNIKAVMKEIEYVQATLDVEASRLDGDRFIFDNEVWDELIGTEEEEEEQGGEQERSVPHHEGAEDASKRKGQPAIRWLLTQGGVRRLRNPFESIPPAMWGAVRGGEMGGEYANGLLSEGEFFLSSHTPEDVRKWLEGFRDTVQGESVDQGGASAREGTGCG